MRERIIVAALHGRKTTKRYYTTLDNAISGLIRFMVQKAKVGDVCEVYHRITGMQLGTLRMDCKGKIQVSWSWEENL